jgi:hypothetical protein
MELPEIQKAVKLDTKGGYRGHRRCLRQPSGPLLLWLGPAQGSRHGGDLCDQVLEHG